MMDFIGVLFKSWISYILLIYLCDCNVTFFGLFLFLPSCYVELFWIFRVVVTFSCSTVGCLCCKLILISCNVTNFGLRMLVSVTFICKLFVFSLLHGTNS
jgi:hypothetical protein